MEGMSGSGAVIGSKILAGTIIDPIQSDLLQTLDTQKKEKSFVVVLTAVLS